MESNQMLEVIWRNEAKIGSSILKLVFLSQAAGR